MRVVILAYIHLDLDSSYKIIGRQTGFPRDTVSRILKKNKILAYHKSLVHTLTLSTRDNQQQMTFYNWFLWHW